MVNQLKEFDGLKNPISNPDKGLKKSGKLPPLSTLAMLSLLD